MLVSLKVTARETSSYFFILPKKHVRLAVLRNKIKRHVRELTKHLRAKITLRVSSSVTKQNIQDVLLQIKKQFESLKG